MFTKKELDKMKNGDIVGYDNGNNQKFPVRVSKNDGDFSDSDLNYFFCEEYDCCYSLEELTPDWFVKA